jgi:hypothetical protein
MNKLIKQISYFVAFAVVNDKNTIVEMLQSSGIKVPIKVSDNDLIDLVFQSFDNAFFKVKFENYLKNRFNEKSNQNFKNSVGPTTATSGSSFWSGFNASAITGLVSTGLGFLSSSQQGKDARAVAGEQAKSNLAIATANLEANKTQLEIAKLQLAAAQSAPKSNNTALYAILGIVGLVVIVGGILVVKKMNSSK